MAWFSRWRKRSIASIPMDDLRKGKIRLEQEQARINKKVKELDHQILLLFQEGVSINSEREKLMLSRRMKQLDTQAKNYAESLPMLSDQIQSINTIIQNRELEKTAKIGLPGIFPGVDIESIIGDTAKMMADIEWERVKSDELRRALVDSKSLIESGGEDAEILKIMELMNEAREAQKENPEEAIEKTYQKVNQTLRGKPEAEAI